MGKHLNPRKLIPLETRFWRTVDVRGPDECWPWLGGVTKRGYGKVDDQGRDLRAHRVCWTLCFGPIPDGMDVLHSCDNPSCNNPRDLLLGTNADNMADRDAKGRMARGERAGGAKLTEAQVVSIRLATGTARKIAALYNVSPSLIGLIVARKVWRHVP